jgi:hypothetical protein
LRRSLIQLTIIAACALLVLAPAAAGNAGPLPEGQWWKGMDYPQIISTLKQARSYHLRAAKLAGTPLAVHAELEGVDVESSIAMHHKRAKELAQSIRDKENEYDGVLKRIREQKAELQATLDAVPAAPTAGWAVWDELAGCEAGGNWATNTGNSFYGGLQFTYGTWTANGGAAFSTSGPFPFSREQQIAVAENVLASQGWGAWPVCSIKLGLR